jgi:hypothetical protein
MWATEAEDSAYPILKFAVEKIISVVFQLYNFLYIPLYLSSSILF